MKNQWPGLRFELVESLRLAWYKRDDLNDGLVGLWTAERIQAGKAIVIPTEPGLDRFGLRMEMWV